LDPPQPKYLPKSRRPPYSCQLGLHVSEKNSYKFFFEVFFFFSATFYYVPWIWQKEMGKKTRKISPFLYIVVGEGSENRPFWN
jgi:hypothetical protein